MNRKNNKNKLAWSQPRIIDVDGDLDGVEAGTGAVSEGAGRTTS